MAVIFFRQWIEWKWLFSTRQFGFMHQMYHGNNLLAIMTDWVITKGLELKIISIYLDKLYDSVKISVVQSLENKGFILFVCMIVSIRYEALT
jgi:hypothetical protein